MGNAIETARPKSQQTEPARRLFGTFEQSVQDQLNKMSPDQLLGQLHLANQEFGKLGARTPLAFMFAFAERYGHMYEDRRYGKGQGVRRTPINCLAVICHGEPRLLRELNTDQFTELLRVISHASMAFDTLLVKTNGKIDLPEAFENSPMDTLPHDGKEVPKPLPPIDPIGLQRC